MGDINLASQFSGPYIQTFVTAVQNKINTRQWIIDYISTLTIDTADETRIVTLGGIIGVIWPSAPPGIYDSGGFTFGTASAFPSIDTSHGFAPHDGSYGGVFGSAFPYSGNLIPISSYRRLLKAVAQLKYNGLTLTTIDGICHVFGQAYTITFGSGSGLNPNDIYIIWTDITASDLWILQYVFNLFVTAPSVFVEKV